MIINKIAILGFILSSALVLSACTKASSSPKANKSSSSTEESASPAAITGQEVVITFTDSGFNPSPVNVKVGDKVTFKNMGTVTVQVNSDPHPVHTSFKELNIGAIGAGQSKSTTFTKSGTYTFHNHLSAGQAGSIVVE